METMYGFLSTIGITTLHQFLSTRKSWLWGAIVPLGYIAYFISIRIFHPQLVNDGSFTSFTVYLFIIWIEGRESRRNNLTDNNSKKKKINMDNNYPINPIYFINKTDSTM